MEIVAHTGCCLLLLLSWALSPAVSPRPAGCPRWVSGVSHHRLHGSASSQSSSAPLGWWRAARALGLIFFIYCSELLGCHSFTDLRPWREAAHFLRDVPYNWTVETMLSIMLPAFAIKRTLQNLFQGNHSLFWGRWGEHTPREEQDCAKIHGPWGQERQLDHLVWLSGPAAIALLSAVPTRTAWCK